MSAQVAADLRAAADVLRRDGWTQGTPSDDAGRCCAIGAIFKAVAAEPYRENAAFAELRKELLPSGVAEFNDAPGRTADEVIAALEAAADAAEAEQ